MDFTLKGLKMNAILKSWKTTTIAILLALDAILHGAMGVLDNDPATNPDWALIMPLLITALGLLFARDSNKSSQDVGIK